MYFLESLLKKPAQCSVLSAEALWTRNTSSGGKGGSGHFKTLRINTLVVGADNWLSDDGVASRPTEKASTYLQLPTVRPILGINMNGRILCCVWTQNDT